MKPLFNRTLISLAIAATAFSAHAGNYNYSNAITYSAGDDIRLSVASTYESGIFDEGAAEIAAYDAKLKRVYITNANANTIDIVSIRNIYRPKLKRSIDLSPYGAGVNSVAVHNGIVAVAVEADPKQEPGSIVFFNRWGKFINSVSVGALPDMVTFTPDGSKVLVANEGEPNDDYDVDPEGSISIIDLSAGVKNLTNTDVTEVGFSAFNGQDLSPIRIFGPGASVAQDLEPEYVAVSSDSSTAWISLQENNAIAIVDIASATVTDLVPLGTKNHDALQNAMDASNRDDGINLNTWPVMGMYMPDAIASYEVDGETYIVTANEGDARDYDGFSEEARVKDYGDDFIVDPDAYPDIDELGEDEAMGRLKITVSTGDLDNDGDIDVIHSYGGRSFSILNEEGEMIFDSGSEFERILATVLPDEFNSTNDENGSFDDRSDDKGAEPEGVTVGQVGDQQYAFIGLERVGGIMVYNVTNPLAPQFVQYINNRDFDGDAEAGTAGDLGPEGLLFIDAHASPIRKPLLVVTNEVSGTTTIYRIEAQGRYGHHWWW